MQLKTTFWTLTVLNLLVLTLAFLPAYFVINESWLTARALPDVCLEKIDGETIFVFCEDELDARQ